MSNQAKTLPKIPEQITAGTQRIPPQNLEAEASVLGALMLDKDAIIKVADFLNPDDFYKETNRLIFSCIQELFESREPIDVLSVGEKLKAKKELETIGGTANLTNLVNLVPSAAHVQHYAKIVHQKGTLRNLIGAASNITELAYKETEDVEVLLDEAESKTF